MAQRQSDESPLDLAAIESELRDRLADLQGREEELKRPPEEGADIGFGKRIGDGTNHDHIAFRQTGHNLCPRLAADPGLNRILPCASAWQPGLPFSACVWLRK